MTSRVRLGAVGAKLRLLTLPLAALAFLALSATPAFAAQTHLLEGTFGPFDVPSNIAIDEATGNVFVADAGGSSPGVEIFGPDGGPPSGVAVTEIDVTAPPFGPGAGLNERLGVAFDNSATSPSKGGLYITDRGNTAVQKFVLNPISEEYEPAGTLTGTPAMSEPLGLAVDAKGNVFVGTYQGTIVAFSPTGTEIGRFPDLAFTLALAFDSAGNLFADSGGNVWKFTANGSGEIAPGTTPTKIATGSTGHAIDRSTDTLYAAMGQRVAQYSTSCIPVEEKCQPGLEFGTGLLGLTRGVATSSVSGDIYVADRGNKNVAIFDGGLATVPDPVTKAANAVKQTAATLNGTVSAAGGPAASCEFEYTTQTSFKAGGFEGASTVPCSPAGPFSGSGNEAVSADVSGLSTEVTYVFRLAASNENGPNLGEALSFATVGKPKIAASMIGVVTPDRATVEGLINPNGGPNAAVATSYLVEYVSDADFKATGYANATKVPAGGAAIGSGIEDVKVSQQLLGLATFATYHARIVAENEAGQETGPDEIFTTFGAGSAGLPDGRVYEQATPVNKNGANPRGGESLVRAASDGSGITFYTTSGIPGGEGAQNYPQYLSRRAPGGSGWSTQGLLPPASNGSAADVKGYSEDLTQAYVTQAEVPGEPRSFYQRDMTTGVLRPMADEALENQQNRYAGESADGSKVLIELYDAEIPSGAGAKSQNTFVWNKTTGTLTAAGVLNTGKAPAKGTSPGSYENGGPGSYTLYENAISDDGSRVFFTAIASRQVYLRSNPTQPQSPLSGGVCTIATAACTVQVSAAETGVVDPNGPQPATLWLATPDGSKAFFTSPGKLTADATTGPKDEGNDLYRYDLASGDLVDLTPDTEPTDPNGADVQGVIGASDDGSYVYFVANGVLTEEPNSEGQSAEPGDCNLPDGKDVKSTDGHCNLYLWHEGDISFIAPQHAIVDGGQTDALNWTPKPGRLTGGWQKTARVTPDGRTLLFRSQEKLTSYDNEGFNQFYRYGADDGKLACVSCSPSGAAPIGSAALQTISASAFSAILPASTQTRSLSADGNRVFFETPSKLVASDVNGDQGCPIESGAFHQVPVCQDVYEWEANGTGSCHSELQNSGCLYLISTGTSPEPSYFGDASVSGNDAFFFTAQSLVSQDKDELMDVYDARVGGGIASQNQAPIPPCGGEACKGEVGVPPATQSPGSSSFSGPGNQKAASDKKKKKRKKAQQRKKKQQKKQRQERQAARKHR